MSLPSRPSSTLKDAGFSGGGWVRERPRQASARCGAPPQTEPGMTARPGLLQVALRPRDVAAEQAEQHVEGRLVLRVQLEAVALEVLHRVGLPVGLADLGERL